MIRLIGRVYDEYGFIFEPADEVPDLLAFTGHYVAPHGAFFVIRQHEQMVGSVGVERLGEGSAELHIRHLLLWSDTRFDRAHVLYERLGFQRTGERALDDINHTREYCYERSF